MDVGFYHLTRTSAVDALPKLLGRTLAAGQRASVLCSNPALLPALSTALWNSTNPDWLPHGSDAQPAEQAAWQPIWLTADAGSPAPNGAQFLFLLGNALPIIGFERVFDLFDGNDAAAVAQARVRWTTAKAAGHRLTYWQQEERGWVAKT